MSGKYGLIIGNTEYIDPGLAQLSAPGKDTEDFARILKDKDLCAFDEVKILLNQLSSSVIEAVDEFFDQKKPDDMLVLYFSGHGVRDEMGSLFLAVKNTIRSRLRSTAIRSDYIREAMDQSRSKRQILILDCCNSGAFPQGTKAEVGGTMGMTRAFQGYGRFVLTASDATQFAWEGDKVIGQTENSLFTHFLVKGLEGEADGDGDGKITVDELYDYAYDQISRVTPKQTPTKSASKQEGEIVLRQITRLEQIKPVALPDELIEAIEDSRTFVREGAVQQLEKLLRGRNLGLARSAREILERMEREDDSRRVSQAATQALEPSRQAEQLTLHKTEEERLASERKAKEETERLLAEQKAEREAERLATIKAEEERKAREEAERKAREEAEKFARAKAERLVKQKAEEERKVNQKSDDLRNKAIGTQLAYRQKLILKWAAFGVTFLCVVSIGAWVLLPLLNNSVTPTPTDLPTEDSEATEPVTTVPELNELIALAQEEGTLNVIALPHDWCNYGQLIEGFKTKYNIEVNELDPGAGSGEELEAIRANKDNPGPQAPDVIDVGLAFGSEAKDEGLIQPYKVSTWDEIPTGAKDPDGYWYGDYYGVLSFSVNTSEVTIPPAEYADLLKPEYNGQVALPGDPLTSNAAALSVWAAGLATGATGDEAARAGLEFFKQLNTAGNFVPIDGDSRTVALGETPIMIDWSYNSIANDVALAGNPDLEIKVPTQGSIAGVYVQAISAYAPHPNVAKLWMEYLYTDEGQLGWATGYCYPIRFEAMKTANKIPQELLSQLPSTEGVYFPTIDEINSARAVIYTEWPTVVGVEVQPP